ncbi:MAG: inorganic phosphate transporter, partial [Elusimicrobiota bacterium]
MTTIILVFALSYAFWNGLHDSPTILAQVISTRSMGPRMALTVSGICEFIGAMFFSGMVLKSMSFMSLQPLMQTPSGIVELRYIVLISLGISLLFNFITWYLGLPSSSTHALLGAMAGAALCTQVGKAFLLSIIGKFFVVIFLSAVAGTILGALASSLLQNLDIPYGPGKRLVDSANAVSGAFLSVLHGANDAPKSLGLFLLATGSGTLAVERGLYALIFSAVISMGVLFGENRILRTLGFKLFRLRALDGLGA